MPYIIRRTPNFDHEAKLLAKKYRSLRDELVDLNAELQENPKTGTPIGHSCYKIRLAIKSKGKGKSGGACVITYVYDKAERESISDTELKQLLANID